MGPEGRRLKIIITNGSPLIQLSRAGYLWLLPHLYEVLVSETAFRETQVYPHRSDAIEIAEAARSWLKVEEVKDRASAQALVSSLKIGSGEAEAFILYRKKSADALLLSDEKAAKKAGKLGFKTMNPADVAREAHRRKIFTAKQVSEYADVLIRIGILDTTYMRKLKDEYGGRKL